jgi:hypothetical protein
LGSQDGCDRGVESLLECERRRGCQECLSVWLRTLFSSWKNITTQAVRISYSSDELALIIVMAQKEAVEVDLTLVSGQRL